jgi:hypothetical protein
MHSYTISLFTGDVSRSRPKITRENLEICSNESFGELTLGITMHMLASQTPNLLILHMRIKGKNADLQH